MQDAASGDKTNLSWHWYRNLSCIGIVFIVTISGVIPIASLACRLWDNLHLAK